jgi:predicted Zn-dependent peptidase
MIGRLANGVPYAVLHRPGADVTTVSVWVLSGSRHEAVPGVAHMLEHVVMQAVPTGRSMRVVDEIEAWGGDANATTSRDHMVLYARVPTPDALAALDVLVAAVTTVEFDDDVVESERRVVVEELRLAAADPTDIVHDVFFTAAFGDHPMGRPVGGTAEGVAALTAADLAGWARANVRSGLVGAVAGGGVDPARFAEAVGRSALADLAGPGHRPDDSAPPVTAGRRDHELRSDTAAVILGGPGYPLTDPRFPAAEVLVELLAGGNASVLNEEIRSRRGLSYDVSGGASGYRDTGVWRIAVSTAPEHRAEVADLATKLVNAAVDRGFTAEEVEVARRRVAGLHRLDAESSLTDVMLYGNFGLIAGRPEWTLAHQLEMLARLDADAVNRCAREMVGRLVVATVGSDLTDGGDE